MTSYLRSLLWNKTPAVDTNALPSLQSSPSQSDVEDQGEDIDTSPAFPSLSSAQRISGPSSSDIPRVLTDSQLMPSPRLPNLAVRQPGVLPSVPKSSSLTVPSTTRPLDKSSKKRGKVALAPMHSPLDWANLKASGEIYGELIRSCVYHRRCSRCITSRMTPRLRSAGKSITLRHFSHFILGVRELMRVAGRDGSKLFAYTHSWG